MSDDKYAELRELLKTPSPYSYWNLNNVKIRELLADYEKMAKLLDYMRATDIMNAETDIDSNKGVNPDWRKWIET